MSSLAVGTGTNMIAWAIPREGKVFGICDIHHPAASKRGPRRLTRHSRTWSIASQSLRLRSPRLTSREVVFGSRRVQERIPPELKLELSSGTSSDIYLHIPVRVLFTASLQCSHRYRIRQNRSVHWRFDRSFTLLCRRKARQPQAPGFRGRSWR
jgi:hypothetical protein